jgi:hypothetical protein
MKTSSYSQEGTHKNDKNFPESCYFGIKKQAINLCAFEHAQQLNSNPT